MKKLLEILRFFFVSPEFVLILLAIVLYKYFNDFIFNFTEPLRKNSEAIRYLSLMPAGLAVWIFTKGKSLLFPEKDKKEILHNWPDYWKLRLGFDVSLFYSGLFVLTGFISWVLDWSIKDSLPVMMSLTSVLGSAIVCYTVYKSQITVNELFIQEKDANNLLQ